MESTKHFLDWTFDPNGNKRFHTDTLDPTKPGIDIGATSPHRIPESDVEQLAINFLYDATLNCWKASNRTIKFGSYYLLTENKEYDIKAGTYFVAGMTWFVIFYKDGNTQMPYLLIVNSLYEKIQPRIKLEKECTYSIGTLAYGLKDSKNKDIVIVGDKTVSGYHAKLQVTIDGKFKLTDLKSMNGTFISLETEPQMALTENRYVFRIGFETFIQYRKETVTQSSDNASSTAVTVKF